MSAYNEVLDLQDENKELRNILRDLRGTLRELVEDFQDANRLNVEGLLTDSIKTLNHALLDIDSVL